MADVYYVVHMDSEHRDFNVWVVVSRGDASDAAPWVSHVLELDLVTQGDSIGHALAMAHEAADMVFLDDLNRGLDPLARRAPDMYFDEIHEFIAAEPMTPWASAKELPPLDEERIVRAVFQLRFRFQREAQLPLKMEMSQPPQPQFTLDYHPVVWSEPARRAVNAG